MRKRSDSKGLFFALVLLSIIGVIMVYSASWPVSMKQYGSPYSIAFKQGRVAIAGLVAMLVISRIDYRKYKNIAYVVFLVALVLNILVFTRFGFTQATVNRWIKIAGVVFMPSDVLKLGSVLLCAKYISNNYKKIGTIAYGFVPMLLLVGITGGLIYKQPDLSTAIVVVGVIGIMFLAAGLNIIQFGLFGGLGIGAAAFAIIYSNSKYDRMDRIWAFLDPIKYKDNEGWQLVQAFYAITSGSLFGLGLGRSRQKFLYLSQAHNDFIFAIICEELGFIGGFFIICLYVYVMYKGIKIANATEDLFGKMLAIGISALIGLQSFVNIAVNLGLIPPTGIVLPYISDGGSSLLIFMIMGGVLLNIGITAEKNKSDIRRIK